MGGGASGKGTSQAKTEQSVVNQQTASTSGIALGAQSHNNTVNVQTADPSVARTAIEGNVIAEGQALQFAGHAADVASRTNEFAIGSVESVAKYSVGANTSLATKFLDSVNENSKANIGLLQSVGQNETDIALQAQRASAQALDASFQVSRSVAPQDPSYALQTTLSKTAYIIMAIVAAVFLGFFITRKRA